MENCVQQTMVSETDVAGIKLPKDELNKLNLGYKDPRRIGMNLLAGYHPLKKETVDKITRSGFLLYNILNKVNTLYSRAVSKGSNQLTELLETGILRIPEIRDFHRELICSGRRCLPIIFRGDSPDSVQFSEFHAGLRGLGYLWAFRKTMEKTHPPCSTFSFENLHNHLSCFKNRMLPKPAAVCVDEKGYTCAPEIDYLLKELFGNSLIKIRRYFSPGIIHNRKPQNLQDLSSFTLLLISPRRMFWHRGSACKISFKWTPFLQKIIYNSWFEIIQRYKNGTVDIEPAPNIFFEQKVIMALLWHAQYREYFTQEERTIFPESYIIEDNSTYEFDGAQYSIDNIIDMPRRQREFIVKYAGLDLQVNWGGQRVYRLKNLSRQSARRIFTRAIGSYKKHREPWIIQKDISQKKKISFLDTTDNKMRSDNMYTLYRPYYLASPDGKSVELIDILAFFRKFFKVHATNDSVCGLVKIQNGS
ncbi:MAG: hypothetical protein WDL87_07815 [Candidatus Omnitrophota bacterium]|jgi:hypothetical protein